EACLDDALGVLLLDRRPDEDVRRHCGAQLCKRARARVPGTYSIRLLLTPSRPGTMTRATGMPISGRVKSTTMTLSQPTRASALISTSMSPWKVGVSSPFLPVKSRPPWVFASAATAERSSGFTLCTYTESSKSSRDPVMYVRRD